MTYGHPGVCRKPGCNAPPRSAAVIDATAIGYFEPLRDRDSKTWDPDSEFCAEHAAENKRCRAELKPVAGEYRASSKTGR